MIIQCKPNEIYLPPLYVVSSEINGLFDGDAFAACLEIYTGDDININKPSDDELITLIILQYVAILLYWMWFLILSAMWFRCFGCGESTTAMYIWWGDVLLFYLNSLIGWCLFMHLFAYLTEIDGKISCMDDVNGFNSVYNWVISGM